MAEYKIQEHLPSKRHIPHRALHANRSERECGGPTAAWSLTRIRPTEWSNTQ